MRTPRLLIRLLAAAGACALASPAFGVVGPASEDRSFADHVVMVLKRGVDRAGFCSAVVVAPRVVLTAAHCVAPIKDMRVHYRDDAGRPILLDVEAVAVHPGYRADALTRRVVSIDLALVRTQTPLDSRFSAAELDESGDVGVGRSLRIFGYGVAREGEGGGAGVLRSAALRVRAPLSAILLWAEDPTGAGAGACTGDSGGPILTDDRRQVVAIATWSAGSGARRCGAVTQGPLVAPQRAWIDSVLAGWRL
ncbi:MAG: S1 family peptidase [Roseiarcus sp.]